MAVQRIPWLYILPPPFTANIRVYNTPGTNQYKWVWLAAMPAKSGVLRAFRVSVVNPIGSPSMAWAIYNTVPDTLDINTLTPVLTGTAAITGSYILELTSDANMPVTRGQPFAVKIGCTAGDRFEIRVGTRDMVNGYVGLAGHSLSPVWSQDDVTYKHTTDSYTEIPWFSYSVEDSSGIDEFLTSSDSGFSTTGYITTTKWSVDSYRLGHPVRISGVDVLIYVPNLSSAFPGTVTCELRRTNPDFTPVMSEPPLATASLPASIWAVNGRYSRLDFLFERDVVVMDGNFCFLIKSSYTTNYILDLRYLGITSYFIAMSSSFRRTVYTSDSGSTWTIYDKRPLGVYPMFTQYAGDVQRPLSVSARLSHR